MYKILKNIINIPIALTVGYIFIVSSGVLGVLEILKLVNNGK
jgi:hypothetical protein